MDLISDVDKTMQWVGNQLHLLTTGNSLTVKYTTYMKMSMLST